MTQEEYTNVCCKCGRPVSSWIHCQGVICSVCAEWGITREEVFPTITDLFESKGDLGRLGAGIIYTDGKRILLLKREKGDEKETWCIPGGRADDGETPRDCAIRETGEEIGKLPEAKEFGHFDMKDKAYHFHVYLMAVPKQFKVKLSDEHSDYEWIPFADLDDYRLHPKLKEAIPTYLKAISSHFGVKIESFSSWLYNKKN